MTSQASHLCYTPGHDIRYAWHNHKIHRFSSCAVVHTLFCISFESKHLILCYCQHTSLSCRVSPSHCQVLTSSPTMLLFWQNLPSCCDLPRCKSGDQIAFSQTIYKTDSKSMQTKRQSCSPSTSIEKWNSVLDSLVEPTKFIRE